MSFENGNLKVRCRQGKYTLILHPKKRKILSNKVAKILVDRQQQQQETEFTIISLDESIFFYDSRIEGLD